MTSDWYSSEEEAHSLNWSNMSWTGLETVAGELGDSVRDGVRRSKKSSMEGRTEYCSSWAQILLGRPTKQLASHPPLQLAPLIYKTYVKDCLLGY